MTVQNDDQTMHKREIEVEGIRTYIDRFASYLYLEYGKYVFKLEPTEEFTNDGIPIWKWNWRRSDHD